MVTPNETIVTEEQVKKDNERFQELNKKPEAERTTEEVKELGELKERHNTRAEKRIGELTWRAKQAEERATELEEKLNKTSAEVAELKKIKDDQVVTKLAKEEFIEADSKKWHTNKALAAMIQNKEITEEEAFEYQEKRMTAVASDRIYNRLKEERTKEQEREMRIKDAEEVRRQYPQFSKDHPSFNPEDPVYKKAYELWSEGYSANPRGLSLSIKRAKEILRIQDTQPDRTGDLNLEDSSAPERGSEKAKEVTLSEAEKDIAERMFTRGDVINPKTQRPYTVAEAHAKALEAKKRRMK